MEQYKVKEIYSVINDKKAKGIDIPALKLAVPGSKSITNRALLAAALADGGSNLYGLAKGDDVDAFLGCLKDLGFQLEIDSLKENVKITGSKGTIPCKKADINVNSAGTAARFLTTILALSDGEYHLDASEQMKKRPMGELITCLKSLGAEFVFEEKENSFPFVLKGAFGRLKSNEVVVDITKSSQFLSGLILAAPLLPKGFVVRMAGKHSLSYVEMSVNIMKDFGMDAVMDEDKVTLSGGSYKGLDYHIEPDMSSAAYVYALCPLLGIPAGVKGVGESSIQSDYEFIKSLTSLGCKTQTEDGELVLYPIGDEINSIETDMDDCPDQAMTMAAIACFAKGPVKITGLSSLKYKESDRLNAIATELTKRGIQVETTPESLTVYPGTPAPGVVDTYEDHRMAMAFSLLGLRAEGIIIDNPSCVNKTFPTYFEMLDKVCDDITK